MTVDEKILDRLATIEYYLREISSVCSTGFCGSGATCLPCKEREKNRSKFFSNRHAKKEE